MGQVVRFPGESDEWRVRLEKAGAHERDTRQAYQLALRGRNELVHQAIDDGYPQSAAARALHISRPSVTRILSMPPEQTAGAAC